MLTKFSATRVRFSFSTIFSYSDDVFLFWNWECCYFLIRLAFLFTPLFHFYFSILFPDNTISSRKKNTISFYFPSWKNLIFLQNRKNFFFLTYRSSFVDVHFLIFLCFLLFSPDTLIKNLIFLQTPLRFSFSLMTFQINILFNFFLFINFV